MCTELLGLFWTLSIVLYVEDKRPVIETNGPHWVGLSCLIHLRTETDAVSETLWSFVFHIQDDG
jgi:hypothetical protein